MPGRRGHPGRGGEPVSPTPRRAGNQCAPRGGVGEHSARLRGIAAAGSGGDAGGIEAAGCPPTRGAHDPAGQEAKAGLAPSPDGAALLPGRRYLDDGIMDQGRQALDSALVFLSSVLGAVLPLLGQTEAWLRGQMAVLGVPPQWQTAAVLAVVAVLLLAVLRVLGGLIRVALVVALIALVVRALAPSEPSNGPAPPARHAGLRAPVAHASVAHTRGAAPDGPGRHRRPAPDAAT